MDLLKNLRSELQQVLESVKPQIQMPQQQKEVELTKGFKGDVLVDTNVLMNGILKDNYVLCSNVLEELERHKSGFTDKARNSRKALRWALNRPDNCVLGLKIGSLEDDNIIATAKAYKLPLMTGDVAMATKARCQGIKVIFQEGEEKKEEISYEFMNYGKSSIQNVEDVYGIKPKNEEQKEALKLLLDNDLDVVFLSGKAGSGKTLLALAAGLEMLEAGLYTKILFLRKQISLGDSNEVGFLKGDLTEKMAPWCAAAYDNLEVLLGNRKSVDMLIEQNIVTLEPMGMLRGRSIANCFMIIDEAQLLTELEAHTVLSRAAEGTKIIFLGDPDQIDDKKLSEMNNGLVISANYFNGWEHAGSLVLKTVVRSRLAEKATEVFKK
jgi:predicted ribonuclease YlaK